jgi:hypothetical protein
VEPTRGRNSAVVGVVQFAVSPARPADVVEIAVGQTLDIQTEGNN